MSEFLSKYNILLNDYARLSQSAGARMDYVQGGGGNTSVKLDDTYMAVKASGFCLSDVKPDQAYAVMDYSALRAFYRGHEANEFDNVEQAGSELAKASTIAIEGLSALRPSVEAGFHSLLGTFVIHSHSVYANLADTPTVVKGDSVMQGETIGAVGVTAAGETKENPHLLFKMTLDGQSVDPKEYLPAK